MAPHQSIAVRHSRVSQGVVGILLYRFPEIRYCLLEVFLRPLAPVVSSSQVEDIGSNVFGSFVFDQFSVFSEKLNLQRLGHSFRDVSLYLENVLQLSVVLLCPDRRLASDIDQLYADPESASSFPHASLKNSSDLEFSSDLAHALVDCLYFITDVLAITFSPEIEESVLIISSVRPSAKYSSRWSELRMAKGRAATLRGSRESILASLAPSVGGRTL